MRHSLADSVKNSNLTRCAMNGSGVNGMTDIEKVGEFGSAESVSYTHLTLPTNREV